MSDMESHLAGRGFGIMGGGRFTMFLGKRFFLAFIGFTAVLAAMCLHLVRRELAERGETALRQFDHLIEAQIDFMMHQDADWIAEGIRTCHPMATGEIRSIIDSTRYDELCLVNPAGEIVGANDDYLKTFNFLKYEKTRPYFALLRGERLFIGEKFRPSGLDGTIVKYAGVPLPDRSGFIQLGYHHSRLENDFGRYFFPMFNAEMRVGQTDFCVIASRATGRITLSTSERGSAAGTLAAAGLPDEDAYARVDGAWSYVKCHDVGDWRVFFVLPVAETLVPFVLQFAVVDVLLLAFLLAVRLVLLRFRRQQRKIDALRAEADALAHKEMLMARKIQESFLPETLPRGSDYRISARMEPAREVGGDFYDSFRLEDGRLVLVVADVSGKGTPAAMFMIRAKTALVAEVSRTPDDLADAVRRTNERLCQQNYAEMFVTAWVGLYAPKTGRLEYVNAGHNPPIVRRATASVEWLRDRSGLVLAALPGLAYRTGTAELARGDLFVAYTDGVTEAANPARALYGEERLAHFLATTPDATVDGLFADIVRFADGADPSDDITVLALRRN